MPLGLDSVSIKPEKICVESAAEPPSTKPHENPVRRRPDRHTWCWLSLWAAGAVASLGYLASYANTPGSVAHAPPTWPLASQIPQHRDGSTLVIFLHPRCPCSRASLAELSRAIARMEQPADVQAVFIRPTGRPIGWEKAGLWEAAAALPGVNLNVDPAGREAGRFGAYTSGHVLVYDSQGSLRFSGGITASRSHEGDNIGRNAVIAAMIGEPPGIETTPVFGCPLFSTCQSTGEDHQTCCQR